MKQKGGALGVTYCETQDFDKINLIKIISYFIYITEKQSKASIALADTFLSSYSSLKIE